MLYVLVAIFILLARHYTFGAVQAASHAGDQKFHTYVQIPNHAFLFLLGGIIAHLRSLTAWRLKLWWFLPALATLLWYVRPVGQPFYDHFEIMAGDPRVKYATACAVVVLLFAFFQLPRHVSTKPLVLLGDASYSVYLLHPFAFAAVQFAMKGRWGRASLFWISLTLTLVLATLVYRGMEKPAIRLGRRIAGRFNKD